MINVLRSNRHKCCEGYAAIDVPISSYQQFWGRKKNCFLGKLSADYKPLTQLS